jgi:hypothetical protein
MSYRNKFNGSQTRSIRYSGRIHFIPRWSFQTRGKVWTVAIGRSYRAIALCVDEAQIKRGFAAIFESTQPTHRWV